MDCKEKSPEARSALFSVASSYWENGSRFSRSEATNNSGYVKQLSAMGQGRGEKEDVLTIWGIIVMFDRSASRLIALVSIPS